MEAAKAAPVVAFQCNAKYQCSKLHTRTIRLT